MAIHLIYCFKCLYQIWPLTYPYLWRPFECPALWKGRPLLLESLPLWALLPVVSLHLFHHLVCCRRRYLKQAEVEFQLDILFHSFYIFSICFEVDYLEVMAMLFLITAIKGKIKLCFNLTPKGRPIELTDQHIMLKLLGLRFVTLWTYLIW